MGLYDATNNFSQDRVDGEFNSILALLDYLIRSHQHIWRNRNTDLLGSFQIDHKLKFCRLLYRQIGGLRSLENLIYVKADSAIRISSTRTV